MRPGRAAADRRRRRAGEPSRNAAQSRSRYSGHSVRDHDRVGASAASSGVDVDDELRQDVARVPPAAGSWPRTICAADRRPSAGDVSAGESRTSSVPALKASPSSADRSAPEPARAGPRSGLAKRRLLGSVRVRRRGNRHVHRRGRGRFRPRRAPGAPWAGSLPPNPNDGRMYFDPIRGRGLIPARTSSTSVPYSSRGTRSR